jgi:hypothetical protein
MRPSLCGHGERCRELWPVREGLFRRRGVLFGPVSKRVCRRRSSVEAAASIRPPIRRIVGLAGVPPKSDMRGRAQQPLEGGRFP